MKKIALISWRIITEIVWGFSMGLLLLYLIAIFVDGVSTKIISSVVPALILVLMIRGYWNLYSKRGECLNFSDLTMETKITVEVKIDGDDEIKNYYLIRTKERDAWSLPKLLFFDEYQLEVGKVYKIEDGMKLNVINYA